MQKVSAYLLERRDGMVTATARLNEADRLKSCVKDWLKSKGASKDDSSGTYQPEDGSSGMFKTESAIDGNRSWWMLKLKEDTPMGHRITTAISVTAGHNRVSVYITLEEGWIASGVKPEVIGTKCPRIVRTLLSSAHPFYHGVSTLKELQKISGFDNGKALIPEILSPHRTIPIVVVSVRDGKPVLPDLATKLAMDLAGLANVVLVNDDASWAFSNLLGSKWSCYWGSVRIFWPNFSVEQNRYRHRLWTAAYLSNGDALEARERLRAQLRDLVFKAAARSVVRPLEIDEIREAAALKVVTDLRERAVSLAEFKELSRRQESHIGNLNAQNGCLTEQLFELQGQLNTLSESNESLEGTIAELENEKKRLEWQLNQKANVAVRQEAAPPSVEEEEMGPRPGEVRFYKKIGNSGKGDLMQRRGACNHNNWNRARGGEQAFLGIERVEGRRNWKSIQHCDSCTGGGMWKVTW